jgi:hypothetical protein
VSSVILADVCPSMRCNANTFTPADTAKLAQVCLSERPGWPPSYGFRLGLRLAMLPSVGILVVGASSASKSS